MIATQLKGFAFFVLVFVIVDAAAFDGVYRARVGREMAMVIHGVGSLNWMGEGTDWNRRYNR